MHVLLLPLFIPNASFSFTISILMATTYGYDAAPRNDRFVAPLDEVISTAVRMTPEQGALPNPLPQRESWSRNDPNLSFNKRTQCATSRRGSPEPNSSAWHCVAGNRLSKLGMLLSSSLRIAWYAIDWLRFIVTLTSHGS
jgi:hypothetical protein